MNDFQNIGIFLQLAAMIILLLKIICTFDCTGVSGRTQILYALVLSTRFLDLPYEFQISLPSFIIKIVYLFVAYLTVLFIFFVHRSTYEREYDTFRFDLLIGACTVMALLCTYKKWELLSILWHFSVFLETFAIFPQIYFTTKANYTGSSLVFYVGMLACYRAFYTVHWIYLLLVEGYVDNYYVAASGSTQFIIYCGYFVWMVPIFKAQYAHLKNDESQLDVVSIAPNDFECNISKNESLFNN
ncbi:PREDICTED: ER lumen protein-retaining receptor 2-like [Ceratosolen solmsi marchali]|uniref:ER lumen protein-retaining receptor 2-like n=1 Tax=Ceratosolen solmsi marchali TaxID=326594 RepID=A0AAJ7DUT6_9HYME|nr:PREDICTED: ER lumen protein-retaining receptor 2-like [Ceratosolen solmsi marchali]